MMTPRLIVAAMLLLVACPSRELTEQDVEPSAPDDVATPPPPHKHVERVDGVAVVAAERLVLPERLDRNGILLPGETSDRVVGVVIDVPRGVFPPGPQYQGETSGWMLYLGPRPLREIASGPHGDGQRIVLVAADAGGSLEDGALWSLSKMEGIAAENRKDKLPPWRRAYEDVIAGRRDAHWLRGPDDRKSLPEPRRLDDPKTPGYPASEAALLAWAKRWLEAP